MTCFEPISTGQTELLYDIMSNFEEKLYDLTKIYKNQILDYGMIRLECIQRLPINKITFF